MHHSTADRHLIRSTLYGLGKGCKERPTYRVVVSTQIWFSFCELLRIR